MCCARMQLYGTNILHTYLMYSCERECAKNVGSVQRHVFSKNPNPLQTVDRNCIRVNGGIRDLYLIGLGYLIEY